MEIGDARKAIEYYKQAMLIHREVGDRRGQAIVLEDIGTAYSGIGDARKAIEYHKQALEIVREVGDR